MGDLFHVQFIDSWMQTVAGSSPLNTIKHSSLLWGFWPLVRCFTTLCDNVLSWLMWTKKSNEQSVWNIADKGPIWDWNVVLFSHFLWVLCEIKTNQLCYNYHIINQRIKPRLSCCQMKKKAVAAWIKTILLFHRHLQEAGHPCTVPVCGHGGCGALRQLHVVRGEEEVVCYGRCHSTGRQHVRIVCWRTGVLRGLAEGESAHPSALNTESVVIWLPATSLFSCNSSVFINFSNTKRP